MSAIRSRQELARAAWRTWGSRGLARRASYELAKRTGRIRSFEDRWLAEHGATPRALRRVGLNSQHSAPALSAVEGLAGERTIALYGGGVVIARENPIHWHRHPLTGHAHDPRAHWSSISDAAPEQGDIKDIWERSRLGWLAIDLRRWATGSDEAAAELIWSTIEDWHRQNPPYRGPNWMCGQETSLRTITSMFLADALRSSSATTTEREVLIASMVRDAVGRVLPTLGYALSQRNNHAISEAGFLWTAALLAPDLPDAARIRRAAQDALAEAVRDQFAPDGSYAQQSPTYQRLALHVLLWVLAVARATGEPAPDGVVEAVRASSRFLASLVAPGSDGQVPNLGGNDGALLFDLVGVPISDFRPVVSHAAAATGQASPFPPGPWHQEAAWFSLVSSPERPEAATSSSRGVRTVNIHPLTRGEVHAVLRAGPMCHRPAHADQLHVDVWIDGRPVALDPGSFRYTAPAPWGNALAGEEVHNLPTRAGAPQAVRAGRFFWRSWQEAAVVWAAETDEWAVRLATLSLADRATLRRLVAVRRDLAVVIDRTSEPVTVRWNLPAEARLRVRDATTTARGDRWRAAFASDSPMTLGEPHAHEPASGWHAPRYGEKLPISVLHVPVRTGGAAAAFTPNQSEADDSLVVRLLDLDLTGSAAAVLDRLDQLLSSPGQVS